MWTSKRDGEFVRRQLRYKSLEAMYKDHDQGLVWITWDAFLRYFREVSICKVQIRGVDDPPGRLPAFSAVLISPFYSSFTTAFFCSFSSSSFCSFS